MGMTNGELAKLFGAVKAHPSIKELQKAVALIHKIDAELRKTKDHPRRQVPEKTLQLVHELGVIIDRFPPPPPRPMGICGEGAFPGWPLLVCGERPFKKGDLVEKVKKGTAKRDVKRPL